MIEFYGQIKAVHIGAVVLSGALFALRGLLVQAGRPALGMAAPLRWSSYAIDTVLLTAAMMLLTILPGALFANGWLATKLALLVAYVGVGTYALKRGRTPRVRTACYVLALAIYASMFTIARAHHPLGWLHAWLA